MNPSFVLIGASQLGKHVSTRLKRAGYTVLAYADNSAAKQGTRVDGIEVLSPAEAAKKFPEATFVVTIYTHSRLRPQLDALGLRYLTVSEFARQFPEAFLPFMYLDRPEKVAPWKDAIAETAAIWSDYASLRCYFEQVHHRMTLQALPPTFTNPAQTYFDDDVFQLREDEVFVNCGAYDGDTVKAFLDKAKGRFRKIFALEPDAENFAKLCASTAHLGGQIENVQAAAYDREGALFFNASGDVEASVTDDTGCCEIAARTVDSIVGDEVVTLIHMDIEGSEPRALEGCRQVIARDRPVLAICLYHRMEDLWEIPRQVRRIYPDYHFYLRRYSDDGWELVLYAVPPDRVRTEPAGA